MSKTQALALAALLVDFEIETPVCSEAKGWQRDLKEAREILSAMLREIHPPPPPLPAEMMEYSQPSNFTIAPAAAKNR